MKKKSKNGRHARRKQHLRKKYYKSCSTTKAISHELNDLSELQHMASTNGIKPLLIGQQSSLKKKYYPSYIEVNINPILFLHDYSIMSNKDFSQVLSAVITADADRDYLLELCKNEAIFHYVRQLAQSINKLSYSKLQHEQWTYYYDLGMTDGIWSGLVSKKMAQVNSMCYTYGRGKALIEQRQKYFQKQIEHNTHELDESRKQIPTSIDSDKLISIITAFIQQDQSNLRIELDRRRAMLKFDAKDHQLVEAFYQLKPRQTEVRLFILDTFHAFSFHTI
ncbi:unnamed protein product [Rotaria sp. Silwood1]|nr:unnamed protein product [Rotaria sp. Silwood1]CAF1613914.1 unnamed protein product [Rotaria sp. Silwood1]CAF3740595.1 unnamed protein product [Rotaria sp. Silwood1]